MGQKIMTVHVELQSEGSPGGDPEITQAEFFIYKIKIIMETFALVKLKECFSGCFIMLWLISIALFHGRKDMNQPLRLTGFLNDLLDAVIFSERPEFPDELNLDAVFICNALVIGTDLFRKRLGETRKIKNTDVVGF